MHKYYFGKGGAKGDSPVVVNPRAYPADSLTEFKPLGDASGEDRTDPDLKNVIIGDLRLNTIPPLIKKSKADPVTTTTKKPLLRGKRFLSTKNNTTEIFKDGNLNTGFH